MAARHISGLLAGAAIALAGGRAAAIDLTGTWTEVKNAPCREWRADGSLVVHKDSELFVSSLQITQTGDALTVKQESVDEQGVVFGDAKHDVGRGVIQRCPTAGILAQYQIVSAKTFPENSKGVSGKMTTYFVEGLTNATWSCKVYFERTSTADPAAPGCP